MAVSDASYGVCYKDEIILDLPEGRLVIRIAQRARRHLLLVFDVDFRSPDGGSAWRTSWDVTVTGDPGTGRQRAAIAGEIRRLRHYYARVGGTAEPATGGPVPRHRAAPRWRSRARRFVGVIERAGARIGALALGIWPSGMPGPLR